MKRFVVDERWSPRLHDELWVAVVSVRAAEALAFIESCGWERPSGQAPNRLTAAADPRSRE
ncbi:MAG TPA: hypothetical protein VJ860_15210 [Polyangia bacterium]|nr:hypothetical protein [Polyangia bacterium]